MSHLFLGVDPKNLSVAPFIPCYRPRTVVKGGRLGLPMHPEGTVHVLANISGYVGSDTLGVAMATKLWEQKGYSLAVDIGTNGEIILGYKGWLLACSAAAGPAFEGAHIQNGMRAGDGAIESVLLENGTVRLGVIGDMPPQGICGSGLIDAVAELLRCGLLGVSGRLAGEKSPALSQPLGGRLRTVGGMREFVLAFAGEQGNERDIVITQKDIRELQLAKAAIAAGIAVLLKEVKIEASQIDRIYLAGAFGNYLDREKAVALGMFPGISVDKIIPIGNAAAEGAGLCLLSLGERKMADRIAVMYAGKIVEYGDARQVFYRPSHPYTWGLLGAMPNLIQDVKSELYAIPGTPPDLYAPPKGCAFAARCPYAMEACLKEDPPEFACGQGHGSRCWLLDPRAPDVTPPEGIPPLLKGGSDHV